MYVKGENGRVGAAFVRVERSWGTPGVGREIGNASEGMSGLGVGEQY